MRNLIIKNSSLASVPIIKFRASLRLPIYNFVYIRRIKLMKRQIAGVRPAWLIAAEAENRNSGAIYSHPFAMRHRSAATPAGTLANEPEPNYTLHERSRDWWGSSNSVPSLNPVNQASNRGITRRKRRRCDECYLFAYGDVWRSLV